MMSNTKGNITRFVNGKKYTYHYKNIMIKQKIWDELFDVASKRNCSIPELIKMMIDKENGRY